MTGRKRTYCSKGCRASQRPENRRQPIRSITCAGCGLDVLTTRSRQRYCTVRCHRANRIDLRPANHKRPGARVHGPVSTVDRFAVYERDAWTCWLCARPVDRTLRGRSSAAPSLDHIVPLIHGGSHDMTNLRLAHFGCNSARRERAA